MKRLRVWWLGWVRDPDGHKFDQVKGFAFAWTAYSILLLFVWAALVAGVGALLDVSQAGTLPAWALFAVTPIVLGLNAYGARAAWRLPPWVTPSRLVPLPTTSTIPPSNRWEARAQARGRMRILELVVTVLVLCVGLSLSLLPLASAINVLLRAGGWIALAPFALFAVVGIFLTTALAPGLAQMGREEYRAGIRTVVSPALAKSAELNELADDLKKRAVSAERIVREVDVLFEELNRATVQSQDELTELLGNIEEGLSLSDLTEAQRRGLRAMFDEDSKARVRRGNWINLGFAVLGIVGGFALSLLDPTKELCMSLIP